MPITITLPDGSSLQLEAGATGATAARAIGRRLAEAAVAVRVDGELRDLSTPLADGASLAVITADADEGRAVLRHSAAHIMAQAVLGLFPGAQYAIGPAIEDGFYYDFAVGRPFTPEDLEAIEARMAEIVAADQPFTREVVSTEAALAAFGDQPFKREIIAGVEEAEGAAGVQVSLYRQVGKIHRKAI